MLAKGRTMKFLTALGLVALLAACNAGATTPSENPLPTDGASSGAASTESSPMAMGCDESFTSVDLTAIDSADDVLALTDELDATITDCADVDEWLARAQAEVPDLDLTQAETFLAARCAASPALASTAICTEVGS
jgi:hypothetical protein